MGNSIKGIDVHMGVMGALDPFSAAELAHEMIHEEHDSYSHPLLRACQVYVTDSKDTARSLMILQEMPEKEIEDMIKAFDGHGTERVYFTLAISRPMGSPSKTYSIPPKKSYIH